MRPRPGARPATSEVIERGDLWWATSASLVDRDPAFRRRMLVGSADAFNRSKIATVV